MKPRPPTLREKRRYLLVFLEPVDPAPDARQLHYSVHEAASSLFGDSTVAGINPAVVMCEGGYAIIKCCRGTEHLLATALATVVAINGERAALRTLAVSGTICALKKKRGGLLSPVSYPSAGLPHEEIQFDGRAVVPVFRMGNKLNLMEKGFKNRELLFLTQEDIEEI